MRFGESAAAIDGSGRKGGEEHEEVEVISKTHIGDEIVSNFDDHLDRLEGDVGNTQKAHEVLLEHGANFVDHQRGNRRNKSAAELPERLLPRLPALQFPERRHAGNGEKTQKGQHALYAFAEKEQKKHQRGREPVVFNAVTGKAEDCGWHNGYSQEDIERWIDVEIHSRCRS